MTDTITTAADANVTDQAIGTLEYVDPSRKSVTTSAMTPRWVKRSWPALLRTVCLGHC